MLFQFLLRRMIREGTLRLITANGKKITYGNGSPPHATIKLHRRSLGWTLGLNPQLAVGEAYMEGLLTIEEGSLRDFLHICMINMARLENQPLYKWISRLRLRSRLKQFNPMGVARRNVAYHYDLKGHLYNLFLDSDRQYSCAYFTGPHVGIEQAQLDKKRHIAAKLNLNRPGLKVLDIGSGWGGMGLYLAQEADCNVTGVTLSAEQYKISQRRARAAGVDKVCRFELRDYRQETGPYDRIVSVGMFEHVGKKNYDEYFAKIRDLLRGDGVCLLHTIGALDEGGPINAFIRKHIFPGADIPSLSEIMRAVERSGLMVTDVEVLRLHYAETLRRWNERFQTRRKEAVALYDERFCRKWEFYLIGCEMSFRYGHQVVFQIQLAKKMTALPVTRDYINEWEDVSRSLPPLTQVKRGMGA